MIVYITMCGSLCCIFTVFAIHRGKRYRSPELIIKHVCKVFSLTSYCQSSICAIEYNCNSRHYGQWDWCPDIDHSVDIVRTLTGLPRHRPLQIHNSIMIICIACFNVVKSYIIDITSFSVFADFKRVRVKIGNQKTLILIHVYVVL